MTIRKLLDLSTAHTPEAVAKDFNVGQLRWTDSGYGWIVWMMHDAEVPDWFKPIHKLALNEGCHLVQFDQDADKHPDLPTYEW